MIMISFAVTAAAAVAAAAAAVAAVVVAAAAAAAVGVRHVIAILLILLLYIFLHSVNLFDFITSDCGINSQTINIALNCIYLQEMFFENANFKYIYVTAIFYSVL